MQDQLDNKTIRIGGMTCVSCERRIKDKLLRLPGISKADISYSRGTGRIAYDAKKVTIEEIYQTIEKLDYRIERRNSAKASNGNVLGSVLVIFAAYILLQRSGLLTIFNVFPQAEAGMSYGMLFVIGLLTSVHCVAMCGGINLSQCLSVSPDSNGQWSSIRPSFLYNAGRVISYTLVGGIVGALGSVVSFSGAAKGIVQLIAGVFMVIMGVNMLGIFPWLRRFNPRLPSFLTSKVQNHNKSNSPLIVGLFNGLMPCGPLQAMQIYALSTGSPIEGALSMLLFSLGTVPLMFGLGALSSVLSKKFAGKIMKAGAALVVILGFSMFNNGLALSGFGLPQVSGNDNTANIATLKDDVQIINTELKSGRYTPITVVKDIPVRWTITAEQGTVNGCNNRIIISEYGIEKRLEVGDNVIEFTPARSGTFKYSCWMGMIRSTITVTDSDGTVSDNTDSSQDYDYEADYGYYDYEDDFFSSIYDQYTPVLEPAGYQIPTDEIAVAVVDGDTQTVSVIMSDKGFSPAVIVMQFGVESEFNIINESIGFDTLLFPYYYAQLPMDIGDNLIYVYPTDDFEFLTDDSSMFAFVKVVEDINNFDFEMIKEEVSNFTTYIQTPETLSSGASCH